MSPRCARCAIAEAPGAAALTAALPPLQRIALSYAPARARGAWLGLLALDARLAGVVRGLREPMLAQIRLAWWRERLLEPPEARPLGEPLLALLGPCAAGLVPLVDGWEAMLGEAPLPAGALLQLAEGRAEACAALALALGTGGAAADARRMALGWALADLAGHLAHPDERASAQHMVRAHDWRRGRLPRALRPLVVLHGMAARGRGLGGVGPSGVGAFFACVRLGIVGR